MNNTPDYDDNLYFEEKKMDCKNCPYTDEYCASGDCEIDNNLTEQWKKGKFIVCNAGRCQYYYVQNEKQQEVIKTEYCLFDDNTPNWKILTPVPSYEKWQLMQADNKRLKHDVGNLGYKIKNQRKEIERQIAQNAQLKDLLKECKQWFDWYHIDTETGKEYIESWHKKGHEIHKKINEVMK